MIKAENDRLLTDIEKLKQWLRGEISRTQAGVRLDLNLEKGRIREEASKQELKMKEVDTRIEQEIAGLRAAIQSSKVSDWSSSYPRRVDVVLRGWPGDDPAVPRWVRLVCLLFLSVGHDQLRRPVDSDWLHGSPHGVLTVPSVIGCPIHPEIPSLVILLNKEMSLYL